ncbi:MAG: tyrosine--tRNA ligase [Defluviitaleaceae bacterium]|nr:tyrosine--tRNA ligase [Defluviitaleaceae bacterium]
MKNIIDTLKERGFIAQMTHESEIYELFGKEKVTFYTGYDPTADSLHIGHFLTFMAMAWMQKAGHRPVVLLGGGTGMVGDPTDRTDMRRVMGIEEVDSNVSRFKAQAATFIDFDDDAAVLVDNGDWLRKLNYMSFIREYGVHFSVNRMLAADTYKTKWERGLTFFELNYMIMQAYDFLELNRRYGCTVQTGGNDQWSNIIAGVDLIRRVDQKPAFGFTFNLLSRADGAKMGKTAGGAIWLDPAKTSPYDFFQYFRNTHDADVRQYLCMLTFMPMEDINVITSEGASCNINDAKEILAYEVTKIVHGEEEATKAREAAKALFSGCGAGGNAPCFTLTTCQLGEGINILDLLVVSCLAPSKSEARRNVTQGGITIDGVKITDIAHTITASHFKDGEMLIQKGKKTFLKIVI